MPTGPGSSSLPSDRPGGAAGLAVSDPAADVRGDLLAMTAGVLERGASRVALVEAGDVVVSEHVALAAHDSDCRCVGLNLMSPPYSPTPAQFAAWLGSFELGLLVQVEGRVPAELRLPPQGSHGWCCALAAARSAAGYREAVVSLWQKLHDLVMWLERESMRRGYYLSVGLVVGDCELCELCDTSRLCCFPYVARPSMEAVGIDVAATCAAAGWTASTGAAERNGAATALTGLVLVV